jgi:hypothetical protein
VHLHQPVLTFELVLFDVLEEGIDMGQFCRSLLNAPLEFCIKHFQLPRLPVKLTENPNLAISPPACARKHEKKRDEVLDLARQLLHFRVLDKVSSELNHSP